MNKTSKIIQICDIPVMYSIDMKSCMIKKYQYMVFVPQIKLTCSLTIKERLENYTNHSFKLYIFHDEDNYKKKIKLQLILDN